VPQVVNALLTQLDRLKRYENVLVLTTSNITQALGACARDRTVAAAALPYGPAAQMLRSSTEPTSNWWAASSVSAV
jgi:hypothetical protein